MLGLIPGLMETVLAVLICFRASALEASSLSAFERYGLEVSRKSRWVESSETFCMEVKIGLKVSSEPAWFFSCWTLSITMMGRNKLETIWKRDWTFSTGELELGFYAERFTSTRRRRRDEEGERGSISEEIDEWQVNICFLDGPFPWGGPQLSEGRKKRSRKAKNDATRRSVQDGKGLDGKNDPIDWT